MGVSWGEIGSFDAGSPSATLVIGETSDEGAISPLVGEMSGRTEGGAVPPTLCNNRNDRSHLSGRIFCLQQKPQRCRHRPPSSP
ncbi:hypothetical protein BQ8482_140027 [Mesorhizobium delmotii]|uniref:Uncharacterized protein n=1 Tax=Mesorhizobium delmotii TaxID=1631247 RepID=A0A2P9AGV3_9HYPH|nr:hypothetical protein BQ8482_140027 [Mesorhizobium delmotii]